jgi:hypothetical protein
VVASGRRTRPWRRAIGSAGERLVHTEEVTGSIPVSPTRSAHMPIFVEITLGAIPVAKSAAIRYGARLGGPARLGEDSIYLDHSGECRDADNHRHCPGRWRGVVSLKSGPDGKRRRKKVSGRNKTEVRAKLAELHDELNDGVVSDAVHHQLRDEARCRQCPPIASCDLPKCGNRGELDPSGAAPHVRVAAVGQRDGHRGDQPPCRPQFHPRDPEGLPP